MSGKNYGPAVSGYLNPIGRNWETTVFQAGKPVLDKELNLQQDIDGGQAEADLTRAMPSGWLANEFLSTSNQVPFFVHNAASLQLQFTQGMVAHVNGWLLNIEHTGVINTNTLTLTAGPAGAGATRMDIVVLEVWRMLLSATPSLIGKSVTGRIWQNGNVKTDPSNDVTLNFPDDIEDTNVGAETTKRVQIQYRLRVIPGVDLFAHPYGMSDPSVVANSVPASALLPDGTPTLFTYINQSPNDDEGLWLAGDGNPANTLGTVDGYMYAIPLVGVFRRNTTAWDRLANQNGGAATPGPSGRPDGYFSDVFEARDLVDLRTGVSPTGWDFSEVLQKNFQFLLDNNLQTEWTTNSFAGGGVNGAIVPWADEIGPVPSDGAGPLIGNFDAVRRTFSARSIIETVTVEIPAPGGAWPATGATVTIDPSALPIYPYGPLDWASFAPARVVMVDFQDAWWIGASTKKTVNAMEYIESATNVGVIPVVTITVSFGDLTSLGLTNESIFIDLVIAYPTGSGLTKTPVNSYGSNSFVVTAGSAALLPPPYNFGMFTNQQINETWREVQLEYSTTDLTIVQAANTDSGTAAAVTAFNTPHATITGLTGMYPALVGQQLTFSGAASGGNNGTFTIFAFISATSVQVTNASAVAPDANNGTISWTLVTNFFRLPERASVIVSVQVNAGPLVTATLDSTGRIGNITFPTTTTSGDQLTIVYRALRPMPQNIAGNLEQMTIYYDAAAPQAARQALLGVSLQVTPKYVSDTLYLITTGAGSQDEGYPWPQGYVQTGGIYPNSTNTYTGEAELSARGDIAITDFNSSTGFLKLPAFIPMVANPDQLVFTGVNTDIEGRSYFNTVPGGTYVPNAYAQDLSNANRHKNVLPMICELTADSPLGFHGQLVLVLLIRYALFDSNNSVNFNANLVFDTTTASVFRIRGNLLNKRST
jgi:hypothetical protein